MIGLQELVLILAILFIVFGPEKLPEMAKELGRALQAFNKARANITDAVSSALKDEESNDSEGKAIAKIAANLGINTEGKSAEQLLEDISGKMVKNR